MCAYTHMMRGSIERGLRFLSRARRSDDARALLHVDRQYTPDEKKRSKERIEMKLRNSAGAAASLKALQECGLLTSREIEVVNLLGEPDSPLDPAVALAETIHLHIKVD